MPKIITFPIHIVADLSTSHISPTDGKLIGRKDAPYKIAEELEGRGSFFSVPTIKVCTDAELAYEFSNFGLSASFFYIFQQLRERDIQYVRFDSDGTQCEGLPEFEW